MTYANVNNLFLFIFILVIILAVIIASLIVGVKLFLYKKVYPTYRTAIADVTFSDLLTVLNAVINTELEMWEKDVFKGKDNAVATNSRFENYYLEMSHHITNSLSPIFYQNMSKYITEEEVISIIGRKVRQFLVDHTSTI